MFVFLIFPNLSLYGYKKFKNVIRNDKKELNFFYEKDSQIKYLYKPYIGWRRKNIISKFVNISGKYNTRKSSGEDLDNSTWFFGGSTMWGRGVKDDKTIPSIYNQVTGQGVFNFGESGWISKQSLIQLISVLGDGHKPNNVFFYDGVNEVFHGCLKENKEIPFHSKSDLINPAKKEKYYLSIIREIFNPYLLLVRKITNGIDERTERNCIKDIKKAKLIAKHLVNNWYSAYKILNHQNINFYAVLQPTLFSNNLSHERLSYHERKISNSLQNEYDEVYSRIILEIENKCSLDKLFCKNFIDARTWMINYPEFFIDPYHLNSNGNLIIVKRLVEITK